MRKFLFLGLMCCAVAAHAVNVQIGFSSYNHKLAKMIENGGCYTHSTPWQCVTTNICGIGGGSHFDEWNSRRGANLCEGYESSGSAGPAGVTAEWEDKNNPMRIKISQDGNQGFSVDIDIAEVVKCPTFGWTYLPYIDHRLEHGVFTMRGDPYSVVVNDTSQDRIVNGVMIKAGEGAKLPFPFWLKMDKVDNIRFFDLTTGEEFFGQDFAGYDESGVYYKDGAYAPMWTGDFRFTDGTKKENVLTNLNQIVFADLKTSSGNVLYATNNMPVYAGSVNITTNIQLNTWWEFDQDSWGGSPQAMINGEVVCNGHSTSHIIPYTVNANNLKVSEMSGIGYCYFTMSQTPQSGKSGGSCVMRCWDAKMGSSTSGYSNTPAQHKAEVSAGMGVARFKLTVNVYTGEWKVEPN